MKRGGIEGPVVALLFFLVAIIGLVAYVGRSHRYGSDEYEWEETTTSVRTEAPMSSEQLEDPEYSENTESQQVESQQETRRSKFIHDYEEHMMKLMDMHSIE